MKMKFYIVVIEAPDGTHYYSVGASGFAEAYKYANSILKGHDVGSYISAIIDKDNFTVFKKR